MKINESFLRLVFFVSIFILVSIFELISPARKLNFSKARRWFNNLFIIITNGLLLRLVFPVIPYGFALYCSENNYGIFNNINIHFALSLAATVVILDLAIYLQHLMFHAVPLFWRIHMVHHADLDIDLTTGLRFHVLEIILSVFIKFSVIYIIGAPALGVFIFEVLLNGAAMFNHGNIKLTIILDKILRLIIVTPDMHRVHHSVIIRETNSNFGFNLSIWDRLFGTYRAQPARGHRDMTIGLSQFQGAGYLNLFRILALPFYADKGDYAINGTGREPVYKKDLGKNVNDLGV